MNRSQNSKSLFTRSKMISDGVGPCFEARTDLDALAAEQAISPVNNIDDLFGEFWPEDENTDEFVNTIQEWRQEGKKQRKR